MSISPSPNPSGSGQRYASGKNSQSLAIEIRPILLREKNAAQMLGMSVRTLQNWRLNGNGPIAFSKRGRTVFYKYAELERYANSLPDFASTTQVDAAKASA